MSMMASEIISLTIVYLIVYIGADKKTSKLRDNCLCEGYSPVTDEFLAQRASYADMLFPFDVIMISDSFTLFTRRTI